MIFPETCFWTGGTVSAVFVSSPVKVDKIEQIGIFDAIFMKKLLIFQKFSQNSWFK